MTPRFSIVVVGYGKAALSARCLASLETAYGAELGRSVELVLVDNASPDDGETAELFTSWQDRATVIVEPQNRNFSGGNNDGARAARGDILVFLNNDTIVPAGALDPLVETASEPDVAAVGIRLLYPDSTIQHAGVAWRADGPFGIQAFHLFQHEPGDLPAAQGTFDLDVVTAACVAMRRELFLDLGGFDEAYANGYEDVDLCLRARVAGYRNVYRGATHVIHDESATRGHGWNMAENDRILRNRWEHLLNDDADVVRELFDARIDTERPGVAPLASPLGSRVVVEGSVSGLGACAAETRAILRSLELAGLAPAARDRMETFVGPSLRDPSEHALLRAARLRPAADGAVRIHVPAAAGVPVPPSTATVLRLAHLPEALPAAVAIWAATPELVAGLRAAGAPATLIEYLPPALPDLPCLPGGRGLLVVLPAEEEPARRALDEAASFSGEVRVVPPVASPSFDSWCRELLPAATVLPPITCELAFAAAAGEADVVLCADPTDLFQRRALLAAAVGTAPVCAPGTAAAVLGADAPSHLAVVDVSADARERRAAAVAAACSAETLAPRIRELVEEARAAAYRPLRREVA
ncbi:MAG TPA: glycosyltransferase family 2 protein [Gaiellaceae bacterium]